MGDSVARRGDNASRYSSASAQPNRMPLPEPQPRSSDTTTAYRWRMSTPSPGEPRSVSEPEALSDHGLDAGYAQLATTFNHAAANADRRTARDRYARRSDD